MPISHRSPGRKQANRKKQYTMMAMSEEHDEGRRSAAAIEFMPMLSSAASGGGGGREGRPAQQHITTTPANISGPDNGTNVGFSFNGDVDAILAGGGGSPDSDAERGGPYIPHVNSGSDPYDDDDDDRDESDDAFSRPVVSSSRSQSYAAGNRRGGDNGNGHGNDSNKKSHVRIGRNSHGDGGGRGRLVMGFGSGGSGVFWGSGGPSYECVGTTEEDGSPSKDLRRVNPSGLGWLWQLWSGGGGRRQQHQHQHHHWQRWPGDGQQPGAESPGKRCGSNFGSGRWLLLAGTVVGMAIMYYTGYRTCQRGEATVGFDSITNAGIQDAPSMNHPQRSRDHKPRAFVCITGQLPRLELDNKIQNLFGPWHTKHGVEFDVALVLSDTTHTSVRRTGQRDQEFWTVLEVYDALRAVQGIRVLNTDLEVQTRDPVINLAYMDQRGSGGNMNSSQLIERVQNHVRQFESLSRCHYHMVNSGVDARSYDIVHRVRDDSGYYREVDFDHQMRLVTEHPRTIASSDCEVHGGINDRGSFVSPEAAYDYFNHPILHMYTQPLPPNVRNTEQFLMVTYGRTCRLVETDSYHLFRLWDHNNTVVFSNSDIQCITKKGLFEKSKKQEHNRRHFCHEDMGDGRRYCIQYDKKFRTYVPLDYVPTVGGDSGTSSDSLKAEKEDTVFSKDDDLVGSVAHNNDHGKHDKKKKDKSGDSKRHDHDHEDKDEHKHKKENVTENDEDEKMRRQRRQRMLQQQQVHGEHQPRPSSTWAAGSWLKPRLPSISQLVAERCIGLR